MDFRLIFVFVTIQCIILDVVTYCANSDDAMYFEINEEENRSDIPKMTRKQKVKLYNYYLGKLEMLKKDIESLRPQK